MDMTELRFAPAEPEDIETLFALNRELIDRYEDPGAIERDRVLAWVRRKLEVKRGEYRRVLCDGQVAGYLRVHEENGEVELDDLYVLPPFQGRGIGTAVLERCLAETKLPIFFYVFTRNVRAIALYERLGFRPAEEVSPTRRIMRRP